MRLEYSPQERASKIADILAEGVLALVARIEQGDLEVLKKIWERLDDRRASRISKRLDYVGLGDKDKWSKLQDDMIDTMIRLEKALKKHINSLKI